MATPNTRQQLKDYALRALGAPVIEINVEDSQVEDRIDEALQYFTELNYGGSKRTYYKYAITSNDVTQEYINTNNIDTGLMYITKVFETGMGMQSTNNIFNVRYQMALNDFYGVRSGMISMSNYVSTMQYMEMVQQLLDPQKQIRFNRYENKLFIDTAWTDFRVGAFLLIEGYSELDPSVYGEIYGDLWLKKYTKALIKRQWGANLSKYQGIAMPGNMTFNGEKLYTEAIEEITKLEEEAVLKFQEPPEFITG